MSTEKNQSLAGEVISCFQTNFGHVPPQHLTEIVPATKPAITIHVIWATPARIEEFEFHARSGMRALMRLFDSRGVPFIASIGRRKVVLEP